jgi:hypothetical protein
MFFFKKPKLVVDCFTYNRHAYELFPVDHSIKFVPEWWKNAPKGYQFKNLYPASTIKRCPAIIEQYKHGLILPLWSDLAIATHGGNMWEAHFCDRNAGLDCHNQEQWDFYADPKKYVHVKLLSPWAIRTKDEVYWQYSKPSWSFPVDNNLFISPGIVNFKDQTSTNVNILLPLEARPSYVINAGQPMAQMIPLSDKDIDIRTHLVSEEDYKNKYSISFSHSFAKGYIRANAIKKQKKCPFHFGGK